MKIKEIGNYERAKQVIRQNFATGQFTHILHILDNDNNDFDYYNSKRLYVNDLLWTDDKNAPNIDTINYLIEYAKSLPEDAKVFVHCSAGVSRSPAAAIIMTLIEGYNVEIAVDYVFKLKQFCSPNYIMISIADKIMGYEGKLLEAVENKIKSISMTIRTKQE